MMMRICGTFVVLFVVLLWYFLVFLWDIAVFAAFSVFILDFHNSSEFLIIFFENGDMSSFKLMLLAFSIKTRRRCSLSAVADS